MPKFERVKDKWAGLRKELNLFGNVEAEVKLEAVTMPIELAGGSDYLMHGVVKGSYPDETFGPTIPWNVIEMLPALAAATSYGSKEKIEGDYERAVSLNKKLIQQKHFTSFEIVQYCFNIKGLSKAAGAQLSRYRHSGHISKSRRFVSQEPAFVYPMYDDIDCEYSVKHILEKTSYFNRHAYDFYQHLREGLNMSLGDLPGPGGLLKAKGVRKEEARMSIPVSSSTERTMWVNVRSLRHIFEERLRADTESELRRLIWMIWDLVEPLTPSFYFDLKEEMTD